jgi:outer membrane protein
MKKRLILLTVLLSSPALSQEKRGDAREQLEPKGFLYGLGLSVNQEIYHGYDVRMTPLPILGYRGDNFRILGPFVSYDVLPLSDINITLQTAPRFQGFDESDSYIFENMAKRKVSMDAGVGLTYEKQDWKIGLSTMFDVLSRSGGYEIKTNVSKVLRTGPIFFEPSISISYLDQQFVDYYYGVKDTEVNAYTYAYQGQSAVNSKLGLSISTPILLGGFTRFSVDYTFYDRSISDSPLVQDDRNVSARLIFSKFF